MNNFHVDDTTKAKNAPLNRLTGRAKKMAEIEAERKNRAEIMAAGQEDDHLGKAEVKRQVDAERKVEKKEAEDTMNKLDMKIKQPSGYKLQLAQALAELLGKLDWIRGWTADVMSTNPGTIMIKGKPFDTKEGILLVVTVPSGEVFHKGMLVTYEPPLDYAGIYTIALQVENTMDKFRGLLLDGSGVVDPQNSGVIVDAYGKPIARS